MKVLAIAALLSAGSAIPLANNALVERQVTSFFTIPTGRPTGRPTGVPTGLPTVIPTGRPTHSSGVALPTGGPGGPGGGGGPSTRSGSLTVTPTATSSRVGPTSTAAADEAAIDNTNHRRAVRHIMQRQEADVSAPFPTLSIVSRPLPGPTGGPGPGRPHHTRSRRPRPTGAVGNVNAAVLPTSRPISGIPFPTGGFPGSSGRGPHPTGSFSAPTDGFSVPSGFPTGSVPVPTFSFSVPTGSFTRPTRTATSGGSAPTPEAEAEA